MKRREFIYGTTASFAAIALINSFRSLGISVEKQFSLSEITISQLRSQLDQGVISSEKIVSEYLKRIKVIDQNGPALNSIIEINPDAVIIAKSLDKELKEGKKRSVLHGIPILIKDNIDTHDKMLTTAGSVAMLDHKPSQDAFIVKKLRDAGAVIIGKTNLSEWANFRSTRSVSGWSSRGGQTRNPYVLDRTPCGSSSGSAVAVAANLCAVSIGTETDGSINCPASVNGIVGIKPTVGLVSRTGIIPISKTQDTAGPFARTVSDAVYLLSAIVGVDERDISTTDKNRKSSADYSKFLKPDTLKGKRIGIEKSFLKKHEMIDPLLKRALDQMTAKAATIIEVEFVNKQGEIDPDEFKVLQYEFKDGLNKYLATANGKVKSLSDLIEFDKNNASKTMPYFQQEILDSSNVRSDLATPEYLQSLDKMQSVTRNTIDQVMSENKLNALCGPSTGAAWCVDFVNGDHFTGYGTYSIAAVAGYPSITVPMGFVKELPVGLAFIGKAYGEGELIEIAYGYEQASLNRREPKFKTTF